MTEDLPSKLKSPMCICPHFTIPSSPASHCTYTHLLQLVCILRGWGAKKHNQSHFIWLGVWGVGRKTARILPHLWKSIITFEIKLPSVQIITCAMLGCYFGLGMSKVVSGRIPVPFSLQLRYCCNQCGSLPCMLCGLLTARRCCRGEMWETWDLSSCFVLLCFVFKGMLQLSSLPLS